MMLNLVEMLLPAGIVLLALVPVIGVFTGKVQGIKVKHRFIAHIATFFSALGAMLLLEMTQISAAGESVSLVGSNAQGMGFLAAALATGMSALGAGIAVAAAAPAAIGAFSENGKNFGTALIFVALGEGVAIYGLLISILIINKL